MRRWPKPGARTATASSVRCWLFVTSIPSAEPSTFSARITSGRGVDVVRSVLSEPLYWIASNAGYDGQATIDQVRAMPAGHGLNALTGEFGDLAEGLARPSSPI